MDSDGFDAAELRRKEKRRRAARKARAVEKKRKRALERLAEDVGLYPPLGMTFGCITRPPL